VGSFLGAKRVEASRRLIPLERPWIDGHAEAQKLRRKRPKGGQLSLRTISKELAAQGHLNERGKPFAAKSVASMLRAQTAAETRAQACKFTA
jgi:hypothetical protein